MKTLTVFSAGATKSPVMASMIPIRMPAMKAPGSEPKPVSYTHLPQDWR